jgi:nitrate reductase gamma subunit
MTPIEFLELTRGPLFDIAVTIFFVGVVLRLLEVVMLGRKEDLSEARGNAFTSGMGTVARRFVPDREKLRVAPVVTIFGYVFHIGFFICLLFFIPHIELVHSTLGFSWPGLPNAVVDAVAVITMLAMLGLFINRVSSKLLRFLSTFEDYLLLLVVFLTLLTGYLAYHRFVEPYPLALGLHLLSVELMLVIFPFTKLMHTFTVFLGRYYNGAIAGRRGVQS